MTFNLFESRKSTRQAPPNNLPDWGECALRVDNSDFIAKRMAEGGAGPDHDSLLANELHRFIYEYDDSDRLRSAWFLHRLELVIEEVRMSEHRDMNLWQPIETAPKDGSRILLATPSGKVSDGMWSTQYRVWSWPYVMVEPTHWMPAPEPPK